MTEPKSFSVRLKEDTHQNHEETSKSAKVVAQIMTKTLPLEKYIGLLARYWHMYGALEDASIALKDQPYVKNIFFEELLRMPTIEADLDYYTEGKWKSMPVMKEAEEGTREFVENIKKIQKDSPELLVAHMYVRYLGDLAGGQMIGNKLRQNFEGVKLPSKADDADLGVKFYVFEKVSNVRELVMKFKTGLDNIAVEGDADKTEDLQQRIIDEAIKAYELNHDILSQLE